MNAMDAREQSEASVRAQKEYQEIMQLVIKATKQGKFEINLDMMKISDETFKTLKKDGYHYHSKYLSW